MQYPRCLGQARELHENQGAAAAVGGRLSGATKRPYVPILIHS